MKVLIACEFSDLVGAQFRLLGHDVTSCDLRPSEGSPVHYQGDIRDILHQPWDLIVAFSPCTRKALSRVRWLHERNLWDDLKAECDLFNEIGNANCPFISRENSQPHRYATELVGPYTQKIRPRQFGDAYKKTVCLWLKGLPGLVPTCTTISESECEAKVWKMGPGPEREKERSRFFPGIAKAMATQWTDHINNNPPCTT